MANTQDIEARLCAYIDGQLDPRERADIEQHLATHPEHRMLLEELARQRDLLCQLPRESAPDDLHEHFTGQLERSALLDSERQEHIPIGGRPNHSPQIYAVAAVLLLAVGLGAAIYFVLSPRSMEHNNFTINSPTTAPVHLSTRGIPSTEPESALAMNQKPAAAPEIAPSHGVGGAMKSDVFANSPAEAKPIAPVPGGQTSVLFTSHESAAPSQSQRHAEPAPVVLVVNAQNPAAAQSEVTRFLGDNKISWQMVSESAPSVLALRDVQNAQMDRVPRLKMVLKQSARPIATTEPAVPASQPGPLAVAATAQPPSSAPTVQAVPQSHWPLHQVILARSLTVAQMNDLKACVARIEPSQKRQTEAINTRTPTTRPTTFPSVENGSAGETVSSATTQPTTTPATTLRAGDVGSIAKEVSVHRIIHSATQPAGEAFSYRADGSAATEPVGGVAAGGPQPAASSPVPVVNQPAESEQAAKQSLADNKAFAAAEVPASPPTSQPAEARINVVIVVQPDSAATTPPAAATEPALLSRPPATAPATAPGF